MVPFGHKNAQKGQVLSPSGQKEQKKEEKEGTGANPPHLKKFKKNLEFLSKKFWNLEF